MSNVLNLPTLNHYPKMTQLARLFPTLDTADGIEPFGPHKLDAWACSGAPSSGGLHAARFILSLWSGRCALYKRTKALKEDGEICGYLYRAETPWRCGPFELFDALNVWDVHHRSAFLSWAREPWWS